MVNSLVVVLAFFAVAQAQMTREEQQLQWAEYFCQMGIKSYCSEIEPSPVPSPSPAPVMEVESPASETLESDNESTFPFVRSSSASNVVVAFSEPTTGAGLKIACKSKDPMQVCNLPWKAGPCRGYLIRYYYNSVTNECERRSFGGCYGNDNNFLSKQECQSCCKFS